MRAICNAVLANHDYPRRFGDRIDCVSDFEVEMVQVGTLFFIIFLPALPSILLLSLADRRPAVPGSRRVSHARYVMLP